MNYKVPPSVDAIEKLDNFIAVNRLTANTRIPSERDLCEMWGVSRSTLRQAVDTLVENGHLYRVKNAGVYVAPPKLVRDMDKVDALIDNCKAQGIRTNKRILDTRIVDATKQMSKKLRIPLGRKVIEIRRVREFDNIPSLLESTFIDIQSFPDFDKHYNDHARMGTVFRNVYHTIQTSGEEHISVTYVSEEEAELLHLNPGDAVFFTSGFVRDQNGAPMMYYKQLLRADAFKFVSKVESNE